MYALRQAYRLEHARTDTARVEGLARVFGETARTRQVIVFTHDDRLPDATRRLGIPAAVLGVTRRAGSVVGVRQTADPVRSYLHHARGHPGLPGVRRRARAETGQGSGAKLLFDHNLSHRLARVLLDVYPGSVHVRELLLERAPDEAAWDYARTHDLAIVSKDSDFHQRSVVEELPPK